MVSESTSEGSGQILREAAAIVGGENLRVRVASGDALDVRAFRVEERMDELFRVQLEVMSADPSLDFDGIVGQAARFTITPPHRAGRAAKVWDGICSELSQVAAEPRGLSTYELTLVPTMWLLTQRRNHRVFQNKSCLEIATQILGEWGVSFEVATSRADAKRDVRVQYGETDHAFVCRMLEEGGIAHYFAAGEDGTRLVLSHAPHAASRRPDAIPFRDAPTRADRDVVTKLRIGQQVRPGRFTLADHDTRLPSTYALGASAGGGSPLEACLETFTYAPGALLALGPPEEGTPSADDRGTVRSNEEMAGALARARLAAERGAARSLTFETTAADLGPGVVVAISDHPHGQLDPGSAQLVVASRHEGRSYDTWSHSCEARPAAAPYRPACDTPKPKVSGVESATVVGPAGDEIHTDEFGRVRVHFHWDRESQRDEKSFTWIPVSQGWGGAGYGMTNLPRVGQEVVVDFLGGDPDRPVVVGRIYTNQQKTPYPLPANKTQSGWKSCSTQGTGGYNEIMFEDLAGEELVRMQAEKDLKKLVKNDEQVEIRRDRTKLVKRDDALKVERDRTKRVDHDETVSIGHDRDELVEHDERIVVRNDRDERVDHDERITIGNDREKQVGRHDDLTVGGNQTKTVHRNEREVVALSRTRMVGLNEAVVVGVAQQLAVGRSQSVKVGTEQSIKVGKNQSLSVGGKQSVTVKKAATETIGLAKALTIGAAYNVAVGGLMATSVGKAMMTNVGGAMSTNVGGAQTEQVAITKTVTVGKSITFTCGRSSLSMDATGTITLAIAGGAKITLADLDVTVEAGGGGAVTIKGGPNVHLNPPEE